MRISTLAGSIVGLLTAMAFVAPASIPASDAMADPCCAITAIDAAKRLVTVKPNAGWVAFEVTLADAAPLRGLRRGQAASLSNATLTLFVYPAAGPVRAISVTSITVKPLAGASTTGAVANAASSTPPGTFRRDPGKKGGCAKLKESSTEQCILTHDGSAEGKGCEYYCVPINR